MSSPGSQINAMSFDSSSQACLAASLADRVDQIAADAREGGLDQATLILLCMAELLRAALAVPSVKFAMVDSTMRAS